MKHYPKIQYLSRDYFDENIYAFDKLDGSNMRYEFNKKSGWYKFGTRNILLDKTDPIFGDAIPIFLDKYAHDLEYVFKHQYSGVHNFVVFGEFLGENSFAGRHIDTDIKDVTLFDVNVYKKGFISPKEFIDNFGHLEIPKLIYKGKFNEEFINMIKNDTELEEGVIVKGVRKTKGSEIVWMTKIKTNQYISKVKELYGEKYALSEFL